MRNAERKAQISPVIQHSAFIVQRLLRHHLELRLWPPNPSADLEVLTAGAFEVVRKVYADVDKRLWPAARSSVKAQLEYLRAERES